MSPIEPRIVPRPEHTISRKRIDPNALKVMYRLHRAGFKGYLCGGGVRDLLLARRPKDFDIATDARPHEVKSLFRNSRIIGRRFKITQVYFKDGTIIQVSTFRASSDFEDAPETGVVPGDGQPAEAPPARAEAPLGVGAAEPSAAEAFEPTAGPGTAPSLLIRRDNVYGTPEEDAFRRDLTINGLFYDISDFSIIDYVGGLADLEAKVIRIIGDPDIRIQEDPVRMIRAIRHSARLDFEIDPPTREAIVHNAARLLECSTARVVDELYRDLRGGAAAPSLKMMLELGLLDAILPELARFLRESPAKEIERTWRGIEVLDATSDYGDAPQPGVLWSILAGPYVLHRVGEQSETAQADFGGAIERAFRDLTRTLAVGRKDAERVKLLLLTRRRFEQALTTGRLPKTLVHRPYFEDAMSYFDMVTRAEGGEVPGWLLAGREVGPTAGGALAAGEGAIGAEEAAGPAPRRRRRRRRRGGRQGPIDAPLATPTGAEAEAIVDTEPIDEDELGVVALPAKGGEEVGVAVGEAPARRRRRRGRRGRRGGGEGSPPPAE